MGGRSYEEAMPPLAEIVEVYWKPIQNQEQIEVSYTGSTGAGILQLAELTDAIRDIVKQKQRALGIEHIPPLHLSPPQAEELRQAIRNDPTWQNKYVQLVGQVVHTTISEGLLVGEELEETISSIHLPWWNSTVVIRKGGRLNKEYYVEEDSGCSRLDIDAGLSHSYITQLMRAKKLPKIEQDSASISNILLTSDKLLVLGYRGGHNLLHTLMTVPAGSLEYHPNDPLFRTLATEMDEETGIKPGYFDEQGFIGRIFDPTLGRNSLYVARSETVLSFEEIKRFWKESRDQREHEDLITIEDDPEKVLALIKQKQYDPTKANVERPGETTPENVGTILPPAAASLLVHYTQREGKDWAQHAEQVLGEAYRFYWEIL